MTNTKRASNLVLFALTISLMASTAFAGGYNLAGVGPKALAMAGAFHGVSDDWSAMYWNPAGLSGQSNMASFGAKVLYPIVTLTPNVPSEYPGYSGYRNGIEQTTAQKGFPAGSFGIVYVVNPKITTGLAVFAPSALGTDWRNLFTGPPYGYNNTVEFPEKAWNGDIQVIDVHPTVSYAFNNQLSVGLGMSVQYGAVALESPKKVPSGAPMPFEHFYIDALLEGDGMGFGYNVGVMYKINQFMKVGASYRGPIDIALEGTVKQTLYNPYSAGIREASPSLAPLFNGGTMVGEPDAEADFPLPGDFGFGLSFLPIPELTIAMDVLWTQWSSVDEIEIKMTGNGPTGTTAKNSILIMHYEDTFKFSVGADYLLCPKNNAHLMAGYYFDPTPIPDESLRPTIADVADKHNISLGLGFSPIGNLEVMGYWEHLWTPTRTVEQQEQLQESLIENVAGDWELQVDTFGLALNFKF